MNKSFETVNKREAFAIFARVGIAMFALRFVTTAVQYTVSYGIIGIASYDVYYNLVMNTWWFNWLHALIPLYGIGLPVFYFLLPKKSEKAPREAPKRMGIPAFLAALAMCIFTLYAGNVLGSSLSTWLSDLFGGGVGDPVSRLVGDGFWPTAATLLFGVILGPLGEEIIFRRLLIERVTPFGKGMAVLFSGLAFGLFHGNVTQFVYAFFVGCLLAFIRISTNCDIYNIVLHSAINFFGMIVSPAVLNGERLTLLNKILEDPSQITEENINLLIPVFIFAMAAIAVFITGAVIFIVAAARGKFKPGCPDIMIEGGNRRAFWLNPYIIISLVFMLALIILTLIPVDKI